jgi:hypothetical protein
MNLEKERKRRSLLHAVERYNERYNLELSARQYRYLSDKCEEENCFNVRGP